LSLLVNALLEAAFAEEELPNEAGLFFNAKKFFRSGSGEAATQGAKLMKAEIQKVVKNKQAKKTAAFSQGGNVGAMTAEFN
jgi:hypothetical protein